MRASMESFSFRVWKTLKFQNLFLVKHFLRATCWKLGDKYSRSFSQTVKNEQIFAGFQQHCYTKAGLQKKFKK